MEKDGGLSKPETTMFVNIIDPDHYVYGSSCKIIDQFKSMLELEETVSHGNRTFIVEQKLCSVPFNGDTVFPGDHEVLGEGIDWDDQLTIINPHHPFYNKTFSIINIHEPFIRIETSEGLLCDILRNQFSREASPVASAWWADWVSKNI